ncbi:MAG TPA: glutamate-1-semialdehyde 2,1-aminomutase [Syntrophorhabdaceae bacterium]|nr:glutamate-1-semialdehyde 2,1-aminomutase [Syntrophorhabdaceae bacterium]
MNRERSHGLYEEAKRIIPAGVNSPVRAFASVGGEPFYVERAKGAYLFDVDGNRYVDYVASWGAVILGHAEPGLIEEVKSALSAGTSFGACHPYEVELAKRIHEAFASMEQTRLVSSGTEATMSAIRLARGVTGKNGIIKFRGCYHGHVDSLLVKAGSGLATFGIPDSKGVPEDLARHTYVAEFNHLESVEAIADKTQDIACIILEPVMGNMGVILPEEGFLKGVSEICHAKGILLIFDEVITGFRVGYGGAQERYGIRPDITCLGKIIGGGFPIGAFGGKKEIMQRIAPAGDVYQAGTLSGNPIAVRAGIYVLDYLKAHKEFYELIDKRGDDLKSGVLERARAEGIPFMVNSITGMFTGFFAHEQVKDYEAAAGSNRKAYELFFKEMLEEGIFFAPSQFEAAFLTVAHGDGEIARTLDAYEKVFRNLKGLL